MFDFGTAVRSLVRSPARKSIASRSLLVGASATALLVGSLSSAGARSLGGSNASNTGVAAAAAIAAQAGAQQAAQTASQAMIRASNAMQGMRSIQDAARAAAISTASTVPNGLVSGGLVVAPNVKTDPTLWQGAKLPTETMAGGRNQVEIVQTDAKAILTWDKFNIGRETDLYFNQTAGGANKADWIALNRVIDPSLAPSRILGTIKAEGQVYVVNRNGIVFGGSSQVNVHTLVATSLSLSNEQFRAGINNTLQIHGDDGFDYAIPTFGDSSTSISATNVVHYGRTPGPVEIETGAVIESHSGGKAIIFAPHVSNAGTIRTPNGQVLLGAGENAWLADPKLNSAHIDVRGLDIAVSSPAASLLQSFFLERMIANPALTIPGYDYRGAIAEMDARAASIGYRVSNTGAIEAARGNITIKGREIRQNGTVVASTALNNQDGSIHLSAWSQGIVGVHTNFDQGRGLYSWGSGQLHLGPNSLTTVLPDLTDTSTIEQSNVATRYRAGTVDLRGTLIDIQAGATVVVPSGNITVIASKRPPTISGTVPGALDMPDDGSRIYIGADALLSVGGLRDVVLAMESNTVQAEMRINELRDSVLYVDSWLRGATVYVDKRTSGTFADGPMSGVQWFKDASGTYQAGRWEGTPLGDVSGWIGTGNTTLAELSTVGGKIVLRAAGETIVRAGATLDVSGGSVRYLDGWITTTKLLGADGRIYDIGNATPDRQYVGFPGTFMRRHERINLTETWRSIFDRSTVRRFEQGYLEGRNAGGIVVYDGAGLAMEGELDGHVITGRHQAANGKTASSGSLQLGGGSVPEGPWLTSTLVITHNPVTLADDFTVESKLPRDFYDTQKDASGRAKTTYVLDEMLNRSGMGKVEIIYNKSFKLDESARVKLMPGASLKVYQHGAPSNALPTTAEVNGNIRIAGGSINIGVGNSITVGSHAVIDVSGSWLNELADGGPAAVSQINGGTVALAVYGNAYGSGVKGAVTIASGAVIDVSGGGRVSASGAKSKLKFGDAGAIALTNLTGTNLDGVDLRGFATGSGGTLNIGVNADLQVGGTPPAGNSVFHVSDMLFADRGFRAVTMSSGGNAVVKAGTVISQLPQSIDMTSVNLSSFATGTKLGDMGTLRALDLQERLTRKPTSLSISALKTLTVESGATIATDVGGTISLQQNSLTTPNTGNLVIAGTVSAPGGQITIDGANITLKPTAQILARGIATIYTDPLTGLRSGNVRDGGSVRLNGGLMIEPSSLIDVSGSSGVIDDPLRANGSEAALLLVSDGGQIVLSGNGRADSKIDGTMIARAGGAGASGGTLSIVDPGVPSGSTQNGMAGTYMGYFKLVGTGGQYSLDAATGTYYANAQSGTYSFIGGTMAGAAASTLVLDLDIYDEYGAAAYKMPALMKTLINNLPTVIGLSPRIVNGYAADAQGGGSVAPWIVDPAIDQKAVVLINKYFYLASRVTENGVVVYKPGSKLRINDTVYAGLTMSAQSISGGGFGGVNLPGQLRLDNGVVLNLHNAAVSIAGKISATTPTASAEIHAGYLALDLGVTEANTTSGTGTLLLDAGLVDITSGVIRGFGKAKIVADEVRMRAFELGATSQLDVDGSLILQAGQIYPATQTVAAIKAPNRISVLGYGTPSAPLSAGGSLTLTSANIDIDGSVRAPFGKLTLQASQAITLGAGANVSVSGEGLTLPYGLLLNGEDWALPARFGLPTVLTALPEKKLLLDAPVVNVAAGASVDIRGGGDLQTSEFVVGSGGSHDILAMKGVYAVVPSLASATAPKDLLIATGGRIWLAGGNGLAAGWYNLLPAQYALLPGAYAVQVVAGSAGNPVRGATRMLDGSMLMAGRLGSNLDSSADVKASSWRVMDGRVIRAYSEYNEASANEFFASEAFKLTQYRKLGIDVVTPLLPADGGSVVFKARDQLVLDGRLLSQAAPGGRAGFVDIAATNIAVVSNGADVSGLGGYLVIDSARLSNFGAASLLLGGVRTTTNLGVSIAVQGGSIVVRNGADSALVGPEIILAASGDITIAAGSVLRAEGVATANTGDITIEPQAASPVRDFGALIRLSNAGAASVLRSNVDSSASGIVVIGAGSVITGGQALLIDATRNTTLAGSAQVSALDITLSGSRIGFGGGTAGLVFDAGGMARFSQAQNLTLRSYSTIDFHTGIDFGAAGLLSVTLDAAGLIGYSAGMTSVSGRIITLRNSGSTFIDPSVPAQGTLALSADRIVLGAGAKSVRGFHTTTLTAATITAQGDGSFDASGNLNLVSPLLTGGNGASQSVTAAGRLAVAAPDMNALRDTDSLGSRWALMGTSVDFGGRIDALGGSVSLTATAGNVNVLTGALIDVGGFGKTFNDVTAYAGAGNIQLTAVGGGVVTHSGSMLNLAAAGGGGDAGKLAAVASGGGTVTLNGTTDAHATAGKGGSFTLDIDALTDFAGLSLRLADAGFTRSRTFRIRSGDVVLDGVTNVENFDLSTDAGKVTITGLIDASAAYGGNIAISAGDGLVMTETANLIARSTTDLGSGRVLLDVSGGRLDIRGGVIDVSGGAGGKVRFRAPQVGGLDRVAVDHLAATVIGARSTLLEGVWRPATVVTAVDATLRDQANAAADDFVAHTGDIKTRLGTGNAVTIAAGIEIRSDADLTLGVDWNLSGLSSREGGLTLRAAGNVHIDGHLSDGFSDVTRSGRLLAQDSWDLRLVAGADLGAANILSVKPLAALTSGTGSVIVGDAGHGYQVRTGTGDLAVRAGRDIQLAHYQSVIYTAGRNDVTPHADFVAPANAEYGILGGHLAVAANGTISTVLPTDNASNMLYTNWLKKDGLTDERFNFVGQQATWWIDYSGFTQGIGAFGGGNVHVQAGGDLDNLTVVLATTGRVHGGSVSDSSRWLQIDNGGALDVSAGGDIKAGNYYIARGTGSIDAGAFAIGRTVRGRTFDQPISEMRSYDISPVLALGDATLNVRTAGHMRLQAVLDPLMSFDPSKPSSNGQTFMLGQTEKTQLNLNSVGGDITLVNQVHYLSQDVVTNYVWHDAIGGNFAQFANLYASLYPALTSIVALNGSISNPGRMKVLPAVNGGLTMLAANDVMPGNLVMARATLEMLPTALRPFGSRVKLNPASAQMEEQFIALLTNFIDPYAYFSLSMDYFVGVANPSVLLNAQDREPSRIYALNGSIRTGNVTTNEQMLMSAKTDIRDLTLNLRNLHATDVTWLNAGNDILNNNLNTERMLGTIIQGPGALLLTAGRDIHAASQVIISQGNQSYNGAGLVKDGQVKGLSDTGASIDLIAGLNGRQPGYAAVAKNYLDPSMVGSMRPYLTTAVDGRLLPLYLTDERKVLADGTLKEIRTGLVSFMKQMTGETLSPLQAWEKFQSLPALTQQRFLRKVYMQELRMAGRDQNERDADDRPLNDGYRRGYQAIAALFPGDEWKGSILSANSLIRTENGGDINILAPGGDLQVAALNQTVEPGAGLVTLGFGRINIAAREDVVVNRSRILTFSGGDVTIWSTLGDIDAGRGAKTTRVPKAPLTETDVDTVTLTKEQADISGSGIGTVFGFAGIEPGDLDLIAPVGTVDAGDAGLRVSGNFNVAAMFVLNTDNIKVGGETKGVPKAQAPAVNLSVETKDNAAADAVKDASQQPVEQRPSVIIVEVLGYGGSESGTEQAPKDDDRKRRSNERQGLRQDPNNPARVVGYGRLTDAQRQMLSEEERGKL